jgi:nucleoid-associated protein YgaU
MSQTALAKAWIINLDFQGEKVQCLFNPKEYTFSKSNKWERKKTSGANVPSLTFGGGDPATLQMELFFDTYASKNGSEKAKDVRKEYTEKIWKLMFVDERLKDPKSKKARPPRVLFSWGDNWKFSAVITQLSQKFTLFDGDGTPVRATLTVNFQQEKDESLVPPQNPTSGGVGGERFWTVEEGDTLGWIAYKELGQTSLWRTIADANGLEGVRDLRPGTVLLIPNG